MKKMIAVLCLLWGSSVLANDSSIPYIEVNDLTFTNADVGTKITFKGADALSLFNALPMNDVMNNTRGFTATGKKKSVAIHCSKGTYNEKTNGLDDIPGGPLCTISVDKALVQDEYGDFQKWYKEREPQSVKEKKETKKKK
jgi:hypothetical protein